SLVPGVGPVLAQVPNYLIRGGKQHMTPELEIGVLELARVPFDGLADLEDAISRAGKPTKKGMLTTEDLLWRGGEKIILGVGSGMGLPMQYYRTIKKGIKNWRGEEPAPVMGP